MGATIGVTLVTLYILGSMYYVYRFRGEARFARFGQYVARGWAPFAPLNCLLYLSSAKRAHKPIMDIGQFPDLKILRDNWQVFRDEALAFCRDDTFEKVGEKGSQGYYDIAFRTFHRYGWRKFYLKWYGTRMRSAEKLCPRSMEILKKARSVNGAMFTILPAGSQLTPHLDPCACSLRYHLGLSTPNADNCFINIDGVNYAWRDGEDVLFDSTYLHYVRNNADQPRLILLCDIDRPTNILGKVFNFFYRMLLSLTVVPNMPGDQRGVINRIFSGVAPLLKKGKELKKTRPIVHKIVKFSLNATLVAVLFLVFYGLYLLVQAGVAGLVDAAESTAQKPVLPIPPGG